MAKKLTDKIKLNSVDELLGVNNEETCLELDISEITPFKDHPYKVVDDDKMQELVESIRENGVLTPVLVRPTECGYEMISGHRRMHAAKLAGLTTISAITRELDDDTATIVMVEANAQREEVLPSEKAFAYKMKLDAIKHQGKETRTSSHHGRKLEAAEVVANEVGESRNQVHRYVRLTELYPELLDMVDSGKLPIVPAVELSYLDEKVQKLLYSFMQENGVLKSYQVTAVRKYVEENGSITELKLKKLFEDNMTGRANRKVVLPDKKLKLYFNANYTPADMEKVIYKLLDQRKAEKDEKKEGTT